MLSMPGIEIRTGTFLSRAKDKNSDFDGHFAESRFSHTNRIIRTVRIGDWLEATLNSRYDISTSFASNTNGISVLLDGYITDIAGEPGFESSSADKILQLYKKSGLGFLQSLRGSYVCLITDENSGEAFLFNDRIGSRPLFYCGDTEGSVLVGAEVRCLAVATPKLDKIDSSAVCEFLIFGSFYSDHTLFSHIKKFPQAALMTFRKESFEHKRYWHIHFRPFEGT